MKVICQVVENAKVEIDGQIHGSISKVDSLKYIRYETL